MLNISGTQRAQNDTTKTANITYTISSQVQWKAYAKYIWYAGRHLQVLWLPVKICPLEGV